MNNERRDIMDIEKIVSLIVNNGSAVALLIYFIYKDNKFTQSINAALTSINDSLEIIRDIITQKGGVKK